MFNIDQLSDPAFYYIRIPAVLISLTVHEWAHAFMAYRYGDTTAKSLGRLSLNPLKHLDPIGTFLLLFAGFGWAKPVPINPANFSHRKNGEVAVSIAGPLSNLVLAVISMFAMILLIHVNETAVTFAYTMVVMNLGLAVLNLLPIPPLDGSHIILPFLPYRAYMWFVQYQQYIFIAMILLLMSPFFTMFLSKIVAAIYHVMFILISLILGRGGV